MFFWIFYHIFLLKLFSGQFFFFLLGFLWCWSKLLNAGRIPQAQQRGVLLLFFKLSTPKCPKMPLRGGHLWGVNFAWIIYKSTLLYWPRSLSCCSYGALLGSSYINLWFFLFWDTDRNVPFIRHLSLLQAAEPLECGVSMAGGVLWSRYSCSGIWLHTEQAVLSIPCYRSAGYSHRALLAN